MIRALCDNLNDTRHFSKSMKVFVRDGGANFQQGGGRGGGGGGGASGHSPPENFESRGSEMVFLYKVVAL